MNLSRNWIVCIIYIEDQFKTFRLPNLAHQQGLLTNSKFLQNSQDVIKHSLNRYKDHVYKIESSQNKYTEANSKEASEQDTQEGHTGPQIYSHSRLYDFINFIKKCISIEEDEQILNHHDTDQEGFINNKRLSSVEDDEEDLDDNSDLSDSEDCSSDDDESCTGKRKRGNQDRKSKAIVEVHGMKINIETITDQEMYSLRKVLPRKDYRLLKNRKSARKSRRRRKVELNTLREEIKLLKKENDNLRKQVQEEESTQLTDPEPQIAPLKPQEQEQDPQATCPQVEMAHEATQIHQGIQSLTAAQRLLHPAPLITPGVEASCPSRLPNPLLSLMALPTHLFQQFPQLRSMFVPPFAQNQHMAGPPLTIAPPLIIPQHRPQPQQQQQQRSFTPVTKQIMHAQNHTNHGPHPCQNLASLLGGLFHLQNQHNAQHQPKQ